MKRLAARYLAAFALAGAGEEALKRHPVSAWLGVERSDWRQRGGLVVAGSHRIDFAAGPD
ncbi:MAG: hypothetical protein ACRED8_12655 [Caulobacteraceae bacterium]